MNRFVVAFILVVCVLGNAQAQQVVNATDSTPISYSADTNKVYAKPKVYVPIVKPKPPKPIAHEWSVGLRLNSNGWSIFTDYALVKTNDWKKADMFHNLLYWQLEFNEKKHPKEQKITTETNRFGGSNSFKYGKINNFYALKAGMGYSKLIAGKPEPGSVSIHWNTVAGFSLGLLKPYYLNIYSDPSAIKYSDITQSDFLNVNSITGSAGFSKGFDELEIIPGGQLRTALHFDFAADKKYVVGVEAGVNVEYYSQEIPLMVGQKATPSFVELFIALQFGKRW